MGNGSQNVYNDSPRWNSHYLGGFVEDDLKVSKNLTLNIGLRYDVDVPRHEALNRTSDLSLTAPDAAAGGLPGSAGIRYELSLQHCMDRHLGRRILRHAWALPTPFPTPTTGQCFAGAPVLSTARLQYSDFGGSMALGFNQSRDFFLGQTGTTGGAFTPAFRLDSSSAADPYE